MIRQKGWHTGIVHELMERWGVCRDTVYKHKRWSDRLARRHVKVEDIPTHKARQAELLDQATHLAMEKGDFASVGRLIKVQAEIIGTIAPVKVDARHTHEAVAILVTKDDQSGQQRLLSVGELQNRIATIEQKRVAIDVVGVTVENAAGEADDMP
jgi:hypothetical protein